MRDPALQPRREPDDAGTGRLLAAGAPACQSSADQAITHDALIALVRALARGAAAECSVAAGGTRSTPKLLETQP
jgi:hypothetical protein